MTAESGRATLLLYLLAAGLVIVVHAALIGLAISPVASGHLVGTDGYLRLVRVTQLYETGAWFDGTIARANAPHGLTMHWTRPFDVLLLLGAWPLTPVLGFDKALFYAGAWISPVLHLALVLALVWACAPLLDNWRRFLAVAIVLVQPGISGYASAGRPDHHILVLLLAVVALGLTWRLLLRPLDRRLALGAGAALGVGLWVSMEFLAVQLAIYGGLGAIWLLRGAAQARKNTWHAAGLVAAVALAAVCEHPPRDLLAEEYDRISIVHLVVATLTLGFWAAIAVIEPRIVRINGPKGRLVLGALGGALTAGLLALIYPKFYGGPAVDVDPSLLTHFNRNVDEMRPLMPRDAKSLSEFLLFLGPALFAAPYLIYVLVKRRQEPSWDAWLCLAVATALFLPLALGSLRFAPFAEVLLAVSLAALLGDLLARLDPLSPLLLRAVARAGLTVCLIFGPLFVALQQSVGLARSLDTELLRAEMRSPRCTLDGIVAALNRPDGLGERPRTILTNPYFGAELLYRTEHRLLGPGFHRNLEGILAIHRIFSTDDESVARRLMAARGVGLVLVCRSLRDPAAGATAGNFYGRLIRGENPAWLRHVELPASAAAAFQLYEVSGS